MIIEELYEQLSKELTGYQALRECMAYLYMKNVTKESYVFIKEDALRYALTRVKGRQFLEEYKENFVIEDTQDVALSIKELLRTAGIEETIDEFVSRNL